MQPQGVSEACIHANVHVPGHVITNIGKGKRGLPILVFIHGGGFNYGSGDSDVYGPEYLVSNGIIVVTFNYRLNIFGFLTLNSTNIPGNQGLRDMVTLLHWVQRNAEYFGGDPDDVTVGGHSAGGGAVELLILSEAAQGLFHRGIIMSGATSLGYFDFETSSGLNVAKKFLSFLNIESDDPESIHEELTKLPLDRLREANEMIIEEYGLGGFSPTVESNFDGVTRIVEDYPQILLLKGRGKNIPVVIGFTTNEMESFRSTLEEINIVSTVEKNPTALIVPKLLLKLSNEAKEIMASKIWDYYFSESIDLDKFIKYFSDTAIVKQSIKTAEMRIVLDYASTYLYQFSYESKTSDMKKALKRDYNGTAHAEDLLYVFRANSVATGFVGFPPRTRDDKMKVKMSKFVANFVRCGTPTCNSRSRQWPPVDKRHLKYQDIRTPEQYRNVDITQEQRDMVQFYDVIEALSL